MTRGGLQQQMEHLDPRRRINKFSSSTNDAIYAWNNKRKSRCEPVPIQLIGSIDLIETYKVLSSSTSSSSRRDAYMRPAIAYSYSHGSTISRSSSSGSSDSEVAARRAHDFKLPKLKRKPVPVYLDEDGNTSFPVLTIDSSNQISVVLLEQDRSPSSASDFATDQNSPKDYDSSGSFSQDCCSRRTSISSIPSALSLKDHSISQSSLVSIPDDKKISTYPSLMTRRTSSLDMRKSIDSTTVQQHYDASLKTLSSPTKSPMSKRKPVPYYILTEDQSPVKSSDSFVCGNMLGLSGESKMEEPVSSKKATSKRKSKHSKKTILIPAATASEVQSSLAPPRPSRCDRALKSGELSPVLSECSFHTAGSDEEDHEEEDEVITAEQPMPLPGCFPHHTARVFVSKNKRGKTKYYVVPPRRADASLQS